MKRTLALLFLLASVVVSSAATVSINFTNTVGQPDTNSFRIIPIGPTIAANGGFITRGPAIPCRPSALGAFSTNLMQGNYLVTNAFLGTGFLIAVPVSTGTYSATDLAISGFNTYNYNPPGVKTLTSTNNTISIYSLGGGLYELETTNVITQGSNVVVLQNGTAYSLNAKTDTNVVKAIISAFSPTNGGTFTNSVILFTDQKGNPWYFSGERFVSMAYTNALGTYGFPAMVFDSDSVSNPTVTVNGSFRASMSSSNEVPLIAQALVSGTNLFEVKLNRTNVAWVDSSGVFHNPAFQVSEDTTLTNAPGGGLIAFDASAPNKKAKISGGVFIGDGSGLTNLAMAGTAGYSNAAAFYLNSNPSNYIGSANVAFTNAANTFYNPQTNKSDAWAGGPLAQIKQNSNGNLEMFTTHGHEQRFIMHRPDTNTSTWMGFALDTEYSTNSNAYVGMTIDYANNADFWVPVFDGFKQWDLMQVGKGNSKYPGRFAFAGAGAPLTNIQMNVADIDTNINITLSLYSQSNGLHTASASLNADAVTIERLAVPGFQSLAFVQGNGLYDWRVGMQANGGYDLTFYNEGGTNASSPSSPGIPVLTLADNPHRVVANVPFLGDGTYISNVIPSYLPQSFFVARGGYTVDQSSNSFTGWDGVQFQVARTDTIAYLARWSFTGLNAKQHTILILNASDGTTNGSVLLPRTTATNTFVWSACNITLQAGVTYWWVTDTASGDGDYIGWQAPIPVIDPNVTNVGAIYGNSPQGPMVLTATNWVYGPLNWASTHGTVANASVLPSTIAQAGATNGQALVWSQSAGMWVPSNVSTNGGSSSATNANFALFVGDVSTNKLPYTAITNAPWETVTDAQALTNNFDTQVSVNSKTNAVGASITAATNGLNSALVTKISDATNQLAIASTNQWQPKIAQVADGWLAGRSNSAVVMTRNLAMGTNIDGGQIQSRTITSNQIALATVETNNLSASFNALLNTFAAGTTPTFAQVQSGTSTGQGMVAGNGTTISPSGTGKIYASNVIGTQTNSTTGSAAASTWATNVPTSGFVGGLKLTTTTAPSTRLGTNAGFTISDAGAGSINAFVPETNSVSVTAGAFYGPGTNNYWSSPTIDSPTFTGAGNLAQLNITTLFATNLAGGALSLSNTLYVGGNSIASSNAVQIDTPQLPKALQVDTNGNTYFGGVIGSGITSYGSVGATNFSANSIGTWGIWNLQRARGQFIKIGAGYTNSALHYNVCIIGDSYSQNVLRWAGDFRHLMKYMLGDAGAGWCSWSAYDPANVAGTMNTSAEMWDITSFVRTGSWYDNGAAISTNATANSPDLHSVIATNFQDRVSLKVLRNYDECWLYLRQQPNGTAFQVIYENPGVGTNTFSSTTAGTEGLLVFKTLNVVSNSSYVVQVNSGSFKPLEVYGVSFQNNAAGVRVHKIAASGACATNWISMPTLPQFQSGISNLAPDLTVIMLGANDQRLYSPTAFGTALSQLVTNVQFAATNSSILLVAPPENGQANQLFPMAQYAQAMLGVAKSNNCAFLDLQPYFGLGPYSSYGYGSTLGLFDPDNLHPTVSVGSGVMLDALMRFFEPLSGWGGLAYPTFPTTYVQQYATTNNFPVAPGAINVDWRFEDQFIQTNANFTVAGFINASNAFVNRVFLSVSNSSASTITVTLPAGLRNYGTNTANTVPIPSAKVAKIPFSLDPHGTNLWNPLQQNN